MLRTRRVLTVTAVVTLLALTGCLGVGPTETTGPPADSDYQRWKPYDIAISGPTTVAVGERVNLTVSIGLNTTSATVGGGNTASLHENVTVRLTHDQYVDGAATETVDTLSADEGSEWTVTLRPDRRAMEDLYVVVEVGDQEVQREHHRLYVGITPSEDPPVVEQVTGVSRTEEIRGED